MRHSPVVERRHKWTAGLRDHVRELEESWNERNRSLPRGSAQGPAAASFGIVDEVSALFSRRTLNLLDEKRSNVLLIGSATKIVPVLDALLRHVAYPVVSCTPPRLSLPDRSVGTIVLYNAEYLSRDDQAELCGWLSCTPHRPQIISTSSVPLLPLVKRHVFSDALFYQLNVVSLMVGEADR